MAFGITEGCLQPDGPCVRVNRVVDDGECTGTVCCIPVRRRIDGEFMAGLLLRNRIQIPLRCAERYEDGLDLIEYDERGVAIGFYEVSRMDQEISGASRDWRMDLAIGQVDFGLLDS